MLRRAPSRTSWSRGCGAGSPSAWLGRCLAHVDGARRGAGSSAEFADRQLGGAQAFLAGGVDPKSVPVQPDALLQANAPSLECRHDALQLCDQLVERSFLELGVADPWLLAQCRSPSPSSLRASSTRAPSRPRATTTSRRAPTGACAGSRTMVPSARRATA